MFPFLILKEISNVNVEISWKLSFISLNSRALAVVSYIFAKNLFILHSACVVCFLFFYQWISLPFFVSLSWSWHRSWLFHSINISWNISPDFLIPILFIKSFCSCFKNHDSYDTDFLGKLSGNVKVWILHVLSQQTRGREMSKSSLLR